MPPDQAILPFRHRTWSARLILGLLVALGCSLIAALVHFNWVANSDRNAAKLVAEINSRIGASLTREITSQIGGGEAALAAVRTILFQDVIRIDNEAKREFIFLSLLQSSPDLSWVSFGWPDGSYFAARKDLDDNVRMVEVKKGGSALENLRIDRYLRVAGDIVFQSRWMGHSDFDAAAEPWYRSAVAERPIWTEGRNFPTGDMPAITVSQRLLLYGRDIGAIAISIDLARLAAFVDKLDVSPHGRAMIVAADGTVLTRIGWDDSNTAGTMPACYQASPAELTADGMRHVASSATGDECYLSISPLPYRGWHLAVFIPSEDILGDIPAAARRLVILVTAIALLVSAVAFFAADRIVTRPLARIAGDLEAVGRFELNGRPYVPAALREFDLLARSLVQMRAGLASFRKYLPADLVQMLVGTGHEAKLGGDKRRLTIFFSDLAGFTGLTEAAPEEMISFLGRHLDDMSHEIHTEGGTIDKFIGDSVMAFWNAPNETTQHEAAACRAALACRERFAMQLRSSDLGIGSQPGLRIGINSGIALVGNIGSQERFNYTAIGDSVNVASRLESLNKIYGTDVIVGEDTASAVNRQFMLRKLDRIAVYGRRQGSDIYELVAVRQEGAQTPEWLNAYEKGLAAYFGRDWDLAIDCFATADRLRGLDNPSRLMLSRCRHYLTEPPSPDWSGAFIATVK